MGDFFGVKELAEYLGVHPKGIYTLRARHGGPPSFKIGQSLRFRKADVDAWVEEQIAGHEASDPESVA